MKWCLCFRVSKVAKGENPLIDLRNDVEAGKGSGPGRRVEEKKAEESAADNSYPTAKAVDEGRRYTGDLEKHTGEKQPEHIVVPDVDDVPLIKPNNGSTSRCYETKQSKDNDVAQCENVFLQNKAASGPELSKKSRVGGISINNDNSMKQSKPNANATYSVPNTFEGVPSASYSDITRVESIKASACDANDGVTSVYSEVEPKLEKVQEDDDSTTVVALKNSMSGERMKYKNALMSGNAIKVPLNTKENESNDEPLEDHALEYNKWNIDGEEHVEIDIKGEYTPPKVSYTAAVLDDEPIYAVEPSVNRNTNYRASVITQPTHGTSEEVDVPKEDSEVNHTATTTPGDPFQEKRPKANSSEPRARPPPLKRSSARIPIRRKAGTSYSQNRAKADLKPTPEKVLTLLEKILPLDESKWKDIMKLQSELSGIAAKYPEVVSACESAALVSAVRRIATYANSSRSNLSHSGITCLGDLYKSHGLVLNQPLLDVMDVCIRKASSGSPEFICTAANSALAKICVSSSDSKACAILLKLYKTNKSASLTILNCMLIVLNAMGTDVGKHKMLPEIFDMVINAIKAGSIDVRRAGKMLIGQINEHVDCLKLLNSMRKGDDAKRLISASLSKYNKEEKDNYLQKLTTAVVQ